MARTVRILTLAFVTVSLFLLGGGRVTAQGVIVSAPAVSYYYPTPVVAYYSSPVVYTPATSVSYYSGPPVSSYTTSVSYYAPGVTYTPSVSYYPAPTAVTTTRYGLFGRPRVSTTYYAPVFITR